MKKFLLVLLVVLVMTTLMIPAIAEGPAEYMPVTLTEPTPAPAVSIDLTGIIMGVLTILFGLASKYLLPLLKNEKNKRLARTAVFAAEQLFNTGVIEDRLEWAENWLKEHGVKVNTRVLIEAVLGEVNQYKAEMDYYNYVTPPYPDELLEDDDDDSDVEEINELCEDCQVEDPGE